MTTATRKNRLPNVTENRRSADRWTVQQAIDCYGLDRWGDGYFGVSSQGNVTVNAPLEQGAEPVELTEIVEGLRQRGLEMPVIVRLENLLADRVRVLNETFQRAIKQANYQGQYRGVFPLKVNQQRHIIEGLTHSGKEFGHGLEVGSKAELLIAMASLRARESLVVCNGYKDQEFIDLGLQLTQLGYPCFFVIENLHELDRILQRSDYWNVSPLIGARVKLSTKVDGHWQEDSGERSLFGLNTVQLMELVDRLRQVQKLDCLQLLHVHLGSQIPNIRNIREGVNEACRYYIDLVKEGAGLKFIDLGGGLAVDYDGSFSTNNHSRNYDLEEYCVDIVDTLVDALDQAGVEHPTLMTESGRWTVAPMSVLLFNVLDVDHFDGTNEPDVLEMPDPSEPVTGLLETLEKIDSTPLQQSRIQENYNDAIYYRDQALREFQAGKINLREKAVAENLCLRILATISEAVQQMDRPLAELSQLRDALSDIYYGNFSVFQSLPDAWAIDQVFPVMPIHRLQERPVRQGVIADLTCDCDGKLDRFGGKRGLVKTLPLHPLKPNEDYLVGVFLVGAYQETLGDLHNLFGDTNVATVRISEGGHLEFLHEIQGDSIADVLQSVEYHPDRLHEQFRALAESGVKSGHINLQQRQKMLNLFSDSLRGFTYFELIQENR